MTCSYETERIAEDRDRLAHNPEVAVYFAWCSSARSNGASPTHSSKASTAGSAGCENEPESCSGHILFGTSGAPSCCAAVWRSRWQPSCWVTRRSRPPVRLRTLKVSGRVVVQQESRPVVDVALGRR